MSGKYRESCLAIVIAVLSVAFLLRGPLMTGFSRVSADDLDGALQLALLEHWRNALIGKVPWHSPNFFYPIDRTLGYNDGYFIYGTIYSGLRSFGMPPVIAQEFVHMALRVLGFTGVWLLLRRYFEVSVAAAAFGSTLATIANLVPITLGHSQLALVGLMPFALILVAEIVIAARRPDPVRAAWCFAALGLLFGSWMLTGFYMFWFTILILLVGAVAFGILDPKLFSGTARSFASKGMPLAVGAGLLAALPGLSAFLYIYVPKLRETGGHSEEEILHNLPVFPADLINFGTNNLVWSRVAGYVYPLAAGKPLIESSPVYSTALTPIMTVAFLISVASFYSWTRLINSNARIALLVFAATVTFLYLIEMRYGRLSPWLIISKSVPGAAGVRVITRMNLVLVILAACVLAAWLDKGVAPRSRFLAILIGTAILAEQVSDIDLLRMDNTMLNRYLDAVPSPPPACKSFYAGNLPDTSPFWPGKKHSEATREWSATDITAMLVAAHVGIPTLNGHATFIPTGWMLKFASSADYPLRAYAYALKHGIEQSLCFFDLTAQTWSVIAGPPEAPNAHLAGSGVGSGDSIGFASGDSGSYMLSDGWSQPESWGTWAIGAASTISVRLKAQAFPQGVQFRLTAQAFLPPAVQNKRIKLLLDGAEGGVPIGDWILGPDAQEHSVCVPAGLIPQNRLLILRFSSEESFSPSDFGSSADTRVLNFGVSHMTVEEQTCPVSSASHLPHN
jgi:hypothetical protein